MLQVAGNDARPGPPVCVMFYTQLIDLTADELVQRHGAEATHIVDVMIDHAIHENRHDEALELDHVRRW
jgi:hypothetical protein